MGSDGWSTSSESDASGGEETHVPTQSKIQRRVKKQHRYKSSITKPPNKLKTSTLSAIAAYNKRNGSSRTTTSV